MKHKAVLFDLDGTLLDTIEDLTDSMNASLRRLALPPRSVAECKRFVGDGVEAFALRSLPPDRRDERTVAACVAVMREEYGRRWSTKTRPYDGIAELLNGLAERGVAMAVLSNKPDDFTRLMVGKLLSGRRFDAVFGARRAVAKKPDATAAGQIAHLLALKAEEFLSVGDTNTDMETANAAGMFPVGALWGFRTAAELSASGAKALVERPTDVLGYL